MQINRLPQSEKPGFAAGKLDHNYFTVTFLTNFTFWTNLLSL